MSWLELASPLFDLARATTGLAANWLIQSTLLVSGGLTLGYLLRDRGSAVQSAVYRTTLVAVLTCPVATWALSLAGMSGWSLQMPEAYRHESITADVPTNAPPLIEPLIVQPAATSAGFRPTFDGVASVAEPSSTFEPDSSELTQSEVDILDAQPVPLVAEDDDQFATVQTMGLSEVRAISVHGFGLVAVVVGTLWLCAGGFLLCRLGLAWWKLSRLRRRAWAAEPETLNVCRRLAGLLNVSPPEVLHSPYLPSPCLAGLRRPAVLLPEAEMSLPVRDVLVHELAHLRRHDCWWNLLRRLATSVLFFQPLLWKLSRRLDSTAEEVCDDYVVQLGGDRRQYAHRLVDIAELSLAPAAAAGVGIVSLRSMLATRVARIMDTSRSLSTRAGRTLLALVLLCGLIGTLLAGFVGITPSSPPSAIEDIASEEQSETDSGSTFAEVTESAEQPAGQTDEIQTVRGRVVDRAGNPIAGARVIATQVRWVHDEFIRTERRQVGETRANADGEFEINMPKRAYQEFAKNRLLPFDWKPATVTATAPGYSPAWIGGEWQLGDDDPLVGNIVLRLENETPSIRGRLIDLEGQPQAGLTVKVMMLAAAEPGKVDEWLAGVEQLRGEGKLPQVDRNADFVFYGASMVASTADDTARDLRSAYFPTKWRLLPGDPNFPAPARSDAEGRFELSGLPPDCLAVLQISGPGVATQSASVVTRAMAKINVPNTGLVGDDAHGYYSIEFDHAVAPGAAVFGKVTDVDSGAPIAGVQVNAHAIVNRMQTSRADWTSTTDAEGRFRIEGLTVGGEKRLEVMPPADQPYLSSEGIKLPESNGIGPVEMNVKLRRGIFVRGKVTVAETGEPVDATLHYHPFLNNDYAKQYDRYDPRVSRYEGNDTRYRTKADGSFQTVVIPGRGILAVQTIVRGSFCVGLGGEDIEVDRVGRSPVFNHAAPYERVLEIDVPPDADAPEYDLTVSRGTSVTYTIRDLQGQPLIGVLASGVVPHGGLPTDESEQPSVEFKALRPGENRRVALLHRDRRLGRIIDIDAPQTAHVDIELRSVTLLPCGEVKGRLINGDGEPVANLTLAAYPLGLGMASAQQAATNANGEFQLEYLPVGAPYRVLGNSREYASVELFDELDFEPGETVDLGTIDITSEERPAPRRTQAKKGTNDDELVKVRGRVVDPNGRAVPGADVYALRWYWDFGERKPLAQVKADDGGRFEISYSKSQFFEAGRPEQWREACITAFAEGFGPGWVTYGELKSGEEATLRLVVDDVPIEGRIVDLEGSPVAGATIEMGYMNAPKTGDLSKWLEAVRAGQSIATAARFIDGFPAFSAQRWQDITTGSDGRFRMTGIGRERQVKIHVKHPSIVTQTLSVVTREMEPLSQPAYNSPRAHDEINYGARFEYAAAPSRPIEGVVRDAKTREPIASVEVWSSKFAGENVSGISTIKTKTDDQGRYRLEGMPKGEGNEIYVVPVDLPYFTAEFEVPDPPGIEPTKLDIELHRGQWISGRVTDKETGRGVSARMYYIVTPDNPIAPTLPETSDWTHIIHVQDRYRTNPDGSYRVVGLPGRGIVAVGVIQGAYPGGQGFETIADRENRDGYMKFNSALSPGEKFPTAMKEIQVAEGDDDTTCDFVLDPGRKVTLRVVDSNGKPVSGVEVQGIREVHDSLQRMEDATFEIIAMRENESRTVLMHQKDRGLGKALRVKATDGEAGPVTVRLEPLAKVSGRLVDGDGEPARGVQLRIWVSGDGDYGKNLAGTATDAEGRFEQAGILPGLAYTINAEGARIEFATVASDLEVQPGESIDVGTIDVTSEERPEPKRTAAGRAQNTASAKTVPADNGVVEASGRVLAPDGKPAAGAEVLFAPRYGATEADLKIRATADADGRFTFTFPRSDLARFAEGLRPPWSSPYIVARMAGSGPVRKHIVEPADAHDVTLQLVADDVAIEGRIVDLEGQPVANAVLRVLRVEGRPKDTLDSWLGGLRNFGEYWNSNETWLEESISQDVSGLPAEVRTDAEGRFTLRGMGRERVVDFRLEGPRLESTELWAMSRRDGVLSIPFEKENPQIGTYVLYNSRFTHSAAPSQPVEGVVRDVDSGDPIAGVTLYCEKRAGREIHGRYAPETKTDERGRYVLDGLPKGADNEIAVVPPPGAPYAPQKLVVDTSHGLESQTVDVDLKAAALIGGRITDEATGKPVANARVEYFAAIANENLDAYPGFLDADDITTTTDEGGRYEIVGLPGRGFLAIRAASDEFAAGQRIDVRQNDFEENPGKLRDTLFHTHPSTCIAEQHHAVAAVEIPTGTTEFSRDVALGRGIARRARILDPEGKPLTGVEANRRGVYACQWKGGEIVLDNAEFTVFGLVPEKPRSLFLKHAERDLVGAFVITADTEEPIEMRLQPAGSLAGRVVDEDGKPISHTTLYGKLADGQGELDRFYFRAATDDAGRFRAAQLVPGLKYQLRYHRSEREYVLLKPKDAPTAELTVASGREVELGDLQAFEPPSNTSTPSAQNEAEKPAIRKSSTSADGDAEKTSEDKNQIYGTVVDATGEPVAGAKFYWFRSRVHDIDPIKPRLIATSDESGKFQFNSPTIGNKDEVAGWEYRDQIVVRAPGHGFVYTSPGAMKQKMSESRNVLQALARVVGGASGATIQLPAAGDPIRGRLVNVDGQPVVGATVSIRWFVGQESARFWQHDVKADGGEHALLRARVNHLLAVIEPVQLQDVLPVAATNADGRFELRDIGPETALQLLIRGEGIESTELVARNDSTDKIVLEPDRHSDNAQQVVYGREFLHAVGPSKPVEGRIVDLDTGEPIANAVVRAFRIHGNRLHSSRERQQFATRTNAEGRYRIAGLPIGADNELVAFATGEVAYVPFGLQADTSVAGEVAEQDFRLKRGVWAEGRVFDQETGKPLTGEITYYYFRNDELEQQIPGLRRAYLDGLYWTNSNGEFRLPVLPTRAILAYRYDGIPFSPESEKIEQYPRGYGADDIAGSENMGSHKSFPTEPHYLIPSNYQRVAEVNPQSGDTSVRVDMPLVASKPLTVRIEDPNANFGTEYQVFGITRWGWQRVGEREFNIEGLEVGEMRKVLVFHRERKLAGGTTVRLGEDGPFKVELQPAGIIRARLVDDAGEPITDATVIPDYDKLSSVPLAAIWAAPPELISNPTQIPVDSEGRFELTGLVPGWKYSAWASAPRKMGAEMMDRGIGRVFDDVTIQPGEKLELGDIRPYSDTPKRADGNQAKTKPDSAAQSSGNEAAGIRVKIRGRVLNPDGQPVAGARIFTPRIRVPEPWSLDAFEQVERGRSDDNGEFAFDVSDGDLPPHFSGIPVLAYVPGYGVAGDEVPRDVEKAANELTLQLPEEKVVRGRVIDPEGRPVEGVRFQVTILMVPKEGELEKFFTGWRQLWHDAPHAIRTRLKIGGAGDFGSATTDADGRFELRGLGADHVAWLQISGGGIAQAVRFLVTRDGVDYDELNRAAEQRTAPVAGMAQQVVQLVGPTFEFVAEPGQTITGTVRSSDGQPIANVRIQALVGWDSAVSSLTDANGKYRLGGLQKGRAELVGANPPSDSPFMSHTKQVADDDDDLLTENVDFVLPRGVVVTGRVVDGESGDGVPAGVRFAPLPGNEYFDKPGYDGFRRDRMMQSTESDGRFRLKTIPGPGMLLVQAHPKTIKIGDRHVNPYRVAEISDDDLKHLSLGGEGEERHFTCADGSIEFVRSQSAMKFLDNSPGFEPAPVEIKVDRGKSIEVQIEAPEGEPVKDAIVAGMTISWPITFQLTDSTCRLYALAPAESRGAIFYHTERQLAAMQTVRGDEASPVSVRLEPATIMKGRAIDEDGEPVASAEISLSYQSKTARELVRFLKQQVPPVLTDADGRFEIPGVLPGLKLRLILQKGRTLQFSEPITAAAPGETMMLDDVVVKSRN